MTLSSREAIIRGTASTAGDAADAMARLKAVHGELAKHMADFVARAKAQTDAGLTLQMPTVNSHYFGFWPDDCLWPFIAVPGLADKQEMAGTIGFLTDSIVGLRCVPDRVERDGLPVMSPGATDGAAVSRHMALHLPAAWTRVLSYYERFGVTIPQKRAWADVVKRSFDQVPFADSLAYSDPQVTCIGFGFHDTIHITGLELMSSLMLYRGLQRAAALFKDVADPVTLARWSRLSAGIASNLHRMYDDGVGGYVGGTRKGRQFSVWANGVAYSLAPPAAQAKITRFYHDNRAKIFLKGCTRQVAEDGWTGNGPGDSYQNGGFWATGTGFVLPAIYDKDPAFAADLAEQLLANLPGTDFAEWLDTNGHGQGAKNFLASLSIPLIGLDSIINNKPLIEYF